MDNSGAITTIDYGNDEHYLFKELIDLAAKKNDLSIEWFTKDLVAKLSFGNKIKYIVGYLFPNNLAGSTALANDKVATFQILTDVNIPATKHILLNTIEDDEQIKKVAQNLDYPVVLKPNEGTGGQDVIKVLNQDDFLEAVLSLKKYPRLAISPFIAEAREFRVVMLNHEPQVAYEKIRREDDWQHNLGLGATPKIVDINTLAELTPLAIESTKALDLNFCSVDIIMSNQEFEVLEVNSGVMMNRFSAFSPDYHAKAVDIYANALGEVF